MKRSNYLTSPEWAAKRKARLVIDGEQCSHCGSRYNLQVHHWNYDRFGNEDVEADLVTLCDDCHLDYTELNLLGSSYTQRKGILLQNDYRRDMSKTIELPAENLIIFNEMEYVDKERVLELRGDRIRLCRITMQCDYYNNRTYYEKQLKYGTPLAPYEEYQWSFDRTWDILVHCRVWDLPGLSKVVVKGSFVTLNNGIRCLFVTNSYAWEGYTNVTKDKAIHTAELLDEYETYYRSLI